MGNVNGAAKLNISSISHQIQANSAQIAVENLDVTYTLDEEAKQINY